MAFTPLSGSLFSVIQDKFGFEDQRKIQSYLDITYHCFRYNLNNPQMCNSMFSYSDVCALQKFCSDLNPTIGNVIIDWFASQPRTNLKKKKSKL